MQWARSKLTDKGMRGVRHGKSCEWCKEEVRIGTFGVTESVGSMFGTAGSLAATSPCRLMLDSQYVEGVVRHFIVFGEIIECLELLNSQALVTFFVNKMIKYGSDWRSLLDLQSHRRYTNSSLTR